MRQFAEGDAAELTAAIAANRVEIEVVVDNARSRAIPVLYAMPASDWPPSPAREAIGSA